MEPLNPLPPQQQILPRRFSIGKVILFVLVCIFIGVAVYASVIRRTCEGPFDLKMAEITDPAHFQKRADGIYHCQSYVERILQARRSPPVVVNEEVASVPAGWLTYQSAQYGLELQYPSLWKAEEQIDLDGNSYAVFTSPETAQFYMENRGAEGFQSDFYFYGQDKPYEKGEEAYGSKVQNKKLGGLDFVVFLALEPGTPLSYKVTHKGITYLFQTDKFHESIADEILSTLRFTR